MTVVRNHIPFNVVDECLHPSRISCRGCEHSIAPELHDGGCRLHYDREYREKILQETART